MGLIKNQAYEVADAISTAEMRDLLFYKNASNGDPYKEKLLREGEYLCLLDNTNIKNILRMADRCGIIIPKSVTKRFNGNLSDDVKAAKELCLEQIEYLQNLGLDDFHFYTLNRSDLTYSILKEIKANEIHEHKSRNAKSWQKERIKIRN